jgi:hypothetical protein
MGNTFKDWIGGIISALSGGMSGALGGAFADPADFNIVTPEARRRLLTLAIFGAAPALLSYLKRRPLPGQSYD